MPDAAGDLRDRPLARPPVRIVLAEDHQVVRRGLQMVLDAEADFTVVAQAGDLPGVRARVREHAPDVLVLDLNLGGTSSLDLIPRLRREHPDTQIVVLTMEAEPAFVRTARSAGALAYVLKDSADTELVQAVRQAVAGEPYLTRRLAARLVAERSFNAGPD